ncbi:hypothetical protein V6N12_072479 [Hibiscus sabdariffa]|uniref:Uncharacterized protein n=1 Tax=Hibiscus sabdariffa TaxID=183260 RepID=A0ABR2FN82_9ROSI
MCLSFSLSFDALGESSLIEEADSQPQHKMDEKMWKNREHIEEILFLLERPHWPPLLLQSSTSEDIGVSPSKKLRTSIQHRSALFLC